MPKLSERAFLYEGGVPVVSLPRTQLEATVNNILNSYSQGRITKTRETQAIDFKEEAGRRNGREILPGSPENPEAATKLADEVACLANTPGGGALIVGVEDGTGRVIGTELDTDWLRQRINSAIQIAPDIVEHTVSGIRLLVIYVAQAREPVEDTGNKLRWRVGDSCAPIDRSAWWQHLESARNFDVMAQKSDAFPYQVTEGAERLLRQFMDVEESESREQLLRKIGALRSDGYLTEAGKLFLCAGQRSYISFTAFDVTGGSILNRVDAPANYSLLEQVSFVEELIKNFNTRAEVTVGIVRQGYRLIPQTAVREALLNGIVHRDWNRSEATEVRWVALDSSLLVRSPGGFFGSVNEGNVLSNREARYPALSDLFRASGLVEKQGVGVDRMYQSMMMMGHRRPAIYDVAGAYVECLLVGGQPVLPVLELYRSIVPEPRQRDLKITMILDLLMQSAFVTAQNVAEALQCSLAEGELAVRAARQSTIGGAPLIQPFKKAWVLSKEVGDLLVGVEGPELAPLVPYLLKDRGEMKSVALQWRDFAGAITSGELAEMCRVATGTAKAVLEELRAEGALGLAGSGRSTRYE